MPKLKILFVLSQKLGWSSYARLLQQAARARDDFEPIFHLYQPPRIASLAAKKIHANRLTRHLGVIDPIQSANLILGRWWRTQGSVLRPDAIHTVTNLLGAPFARLAPSIPLSVTIDCTRRAVQSDFGIGIFSAADIARERAIFQAARRIVCMTGWAAKSVIHDYGIEPGKIITLPFPARPNPSAGRHRRMRGAATGLPRIGFIGTDFKRKGGPALLAWHQAHFRDRAELHIVSKKAPKVDLPNVIIHGGMPNAWVIGEFLPGMDIFCFPTRQDMSPLVLTEAAIAGVPVITYRVGGTPDLVRNGKTGFLIDYGDTRGFIRAIGILLNNPTLRVAMGQRAGRFAARRFNMERHFTTLFDGILTSSRTALPLQQVNCKFGTGR